MPKTAQKRTSDHNKLDKTCTVASEKDHDYVGAALGAPQPEADEEDFPPLPVTPSKPPVAKKPFPNISWTTGNSNPDDAIAMLASLINTRSDALETKLGNMLEEIKDINKKINSVEIRMERNEKDTTSCLIRVTELERYDRRWNLRLHGVVETEKENVLEEVVRVCQEILPREKERLQIFIDIAHRVGRKLAGSSRPRSIIIRFIARRYRDYIWKAAKNNDFLKKNGLRFTEDLCKEDRESRQKLWPSIQKAREEGKSAYFVGGRGFINGVEIPAVFTPMQE